MEYVVLFIDDKCRQASTTLCVESYESVSEVFDREFPDAIDLIDYFEA